MVTMREDRERSAKWISSLSREDLFNRYGITRMGDITGLDTIGVPVFQAVRPTGKVLSVNSGKGLDKTSARVGAIAEAIEYQTFENPTGEFRMGITNLDNLPLAVGSSYTTTTVVPLDLCVALESGQPAELPSDLVWMEHRKQKLMHFQMTSNGQAVGASFESAFLSGLYECIERDATTIKMWLWQEHGIPPRRVDIRNASTQIDHVIARTEDAGLKLYLFDCTLDIPVPVYWAALIDPSGDFFMTFGLGCNIIPIFAAQAAILEAIQGRCIYIAGARDDLFEEDYRAHKEIDPKAQIRFMESVPVTGYLPSYSINAPLVGEIDFVIGQMGKFAGNIYYKDIDLGQLHAVKTIVLGLEPPKNPLWSPSCRAQSFLQAPVCTV